MGFKKYCGKRPWDGVTSKLAIVHHDLRVAMAWLLLCGFSEEFERPQIAPRPEPKPWWNIPMVAIRGQNKPWLRILTLQSLTCRRHAEHAGKGMTNIEWYAVWSLLRLQPISLGFGGPKTFRMLVFCPVGSTWLHKQRCDGVTPCTFRMLLESSRDGLGYWGNAFTLDFYVASAIFHRHISSRFSMIFLYFLARKGQPHEFKCASLL